MILVTGGAGFIGSNIVASLCARGDSVAVCDFLGQEGKWRNLAKAPLCDVVDPRQLQGWLKRHRRELDAIVHMGAISSTGATDADLLMRVNFRLPWFLWQWSARHGKQFVYASSAATYGGGEQGYDDNGSPEALSRLRPLNLYGWSKHLFDQRVARAVAHDEAVPLQWAGLKFFNVYGPNEYHKGDMQSVVARSYPIAATGAEVALFKSYRTGIGDGEQKRDFVFVDDCVEIVLWLLDNPPVNGIFNVGTGEARSFADLIRALFSALDRPTRIVYRDMPEALRNHYQYFTQARVERLRAAGYARPFKTIEEGIDIYVKRYLSQSDPYR